MGYRILMLTTAILIANCCFSQKVTMRVDEYSQSNKKIKVQFKITNGTDTTFTINNYRYEISVLFHFSKSMADSLNYEGLDFQIYDEMKLIDSFYLPVDLRHRPIFIESVRSRLIKFGNKFSRRKLIIKPQTSKKQRIVLDLEGFEFQKKKYSLSLIYYMKNTNDIVESNVVELILP